MSGLISMRQPTISVPLRPSLIRRKDELGTAALQGVLPLWIENGPGGLSPAISFVVDSGAMFVSVGIDTAKTVGIPTPPDGALEYDLTSGTASESAVVRVRPGHIRVWWTEEQKGDPFDWPILFNVAPANRRKQKALLGLGGVITTCSWTIVGPRSSDMSDGYISFEDARAV